MSDAERFVMWLEDSEVNKYTTRKPVPLDEEKKWIRGLPKDKESMHFAIDTVEGIHIGSIALAHINKRDNRAMYGILIGDKNYWGKGYGYTASKLILSYGFKNLKLNRIVLFVYEYNTRGIALYKKLGFKEEGRLRQNTKYKGKYYDDIVMSILKSEWKANK